MNSHARWSRIAGHPAHEPADGLAEEEVGRHGGGVDADPQPRDVDALADHPHGDQPRLPARGELRDPARRLRVVRGHDHGRRPDLAPQQRGDLPGVVLVHGDDEPAGVGLVAPDVVEARRRVAQHRRQPLALERQRGPQPLVGELAVASGSSNVAWWTAPSGALHSISPPTRGKYTGRTTRPSRSASP